MPDLKDPLHHTQIAKRQFDALKEHLREAVTKIDDPRAQALFETSAEVIGGLQTAFLDYEKNNEAAWRDD